MTMGRTVLRCPEPFALYFVCMGLLYPIFAQSNIPKILITKEGEVGTVVNINCTVYPEKAEIADIKWLFEGNPLNFNNSNRIHKSEEEQTLKEKDDDGNAKKIKLSILQIENATYVDTGNYTCVSTIGDSNVTKDFYLNLTFEAKLLNVTDSPIHVNASANANVTISCTFEVYNSTDVVVNWYQLGSKTFQKHEDFKPTQLDLKRIRSVYTVRPYSPETNGTYVCEIEDPVTNKKKAGYVNIFVYAPPFINITKVKAVNTTEIFFAWNVFTYNSGVKGYSLFMKRANGTDFRLQPLNPRIDPTNTSFLLSGLENDTEYQLMLEVETEHGIGKSKESETVRTLSEEPVFVPNIAINGFSATSVTIGWAAPPNNLEELIHYYLLKARKKGGNETRRAYHSPDAGNLPYMFGNLDPHSTYIFQVCACSDYTQRCGPWSKEMEAATLDGTPSKPSNFRVECGTNYINVSWGPPLTPNAEIKGYIIELTGNATYKDRFGKEKVTTWGPLSKTKPNESRSDRLEDLQPNTQYTVRLSAMTRTRRRGVEDTAVCATRPAPPDLPPRPRWRKIMENDKYMFKMYLPRISERNGPICCYRVYMVRLVAQSMFPLSPHDVPVLEYKDVHAQPPVMGAYITDIFSNERYPPESELVMGDEVSFFDKTDPVLNSERCRECLKKPRRFQSTTTSTSTTTMTTTTSVEEDDVFYDDTTIDNRPEETRVKRSDDSDFTNDLMMSNSRTVDTELNLVDGPLDPTANYTLYVELIMDIPQGTPKYSHLINVLNPGPTPTVQQPSTAIEIALQVTCAVAALVLLLMILFCIRQTHRSRKMPPHANLEMNTIRRALRFMGFGGRSAMVVTMPPNIAPIAKEDLAEAYAERQADSDYLFQKEFELLQMLPECFPDRTTHASQARENQAKNRYPDIKAYDQTRVKLSQIDSITGSDYINANYVMGYQERKQFICAQGPTDTTVNDFWRMIWEHGLELIVMLTNLEEYSKVKCSKYWPDDVRGTRAFGNITVHHVSEQRYSDYIVRELKITKTPTTAEGQPIVETNGVARRNGDCVEAGDVSVPTSPRDVKDAECRIVKQFHFLMWKDFAAPEHAYSILKFIKRVNEAWSNMVGRPAVVHCSAGVGRTGTLVALDCLIEQLKDTGHVAIFNTIAELRRQRNFLVQSLKQYVFVYRALVEYAHYGDTEIPACRLKSSIDRLRNTPPGAANCLMEIEFEKIVNNPIPEPIKSCEAGAAEELRCKNRNNDVLPYDRNRVILSPILTREYSTYINASFIEAYDNTEGFIITQDPLVNTIMDFWRMVSEHNVTTIVMLSELGEGKCPRYWEDGTAQYEHISVQYEESESCPYYTRRQFRVINNKSGCSGGVRQLQYQGWPTAPGHVPEVTRGLAELAELADAAPASPASPAARMLVHCSAGTDRSSLFVALCILICQLRTERRVDVCNVARKVRSQRSHTINTFLQYEFLHRAILNYAELHNLLEDS